MRQDQIQYLMSQHRTPQLNKDVARLMGYNTFDWISKDVDAYFAHVPDRHRFTYEVPEAALQEGIDAQAIADLITAGEPYSVYNKALDGNTGRILIHDYQIFPSKVSDSGWKVVFSYSLVQFDTPYW